MKALKNVAIMAVAALAIYWGAGFVWGLFWDIFWKIVGWLQTAVMVAIVVMAIYVLWQILGYKASGDRD